MSTVKQAPLTIERLRKLSDEIAAAYVELLRGESIAAQAHLRAVVAEWSSEVLPVINARISLCDDLVKRGLRDEALGYAAEPPDLFDAANLLNLERFGRENYAAWQEASRLVGLAMPAQPLLDKLANIEAAQQQAHELRPLLERWRRMNIQRAPLPSRIRMLRELHEQDKSPNEPWRQMLTKHETHRLMEIKAALGRLRDRFSREQGAAAAGTEREAEQHLEELRGPWTGLVPPDALIEQFAVLAAESRQRRIDATLDGLVGELQSAHALLDTDRRAARGRLVTLHQAWHAALVDRGVVDPADPRLARVGPICEYIERVKEHDALLVEVDQRERERPLKLAGRIAWSEELDRMMDRIDDTASRLPAADVDARRIADLSDRVARVAESVRREVFFRRLVRALSAAAVCLLVAAVSWAAYAVRRHSQAVAGAVAEANEAVEALAAGGDAAADLGVAWSDGVRRNPQVMAALERVKAARLGRDDRRGTLAKKLGDLQTALGELKAADRTDPLTPWPEPFTRAAQLLAAVKREKLAIVDEESARLEQPAAALRAKSKEFADAADTAFEDRTRRLEADLAGVEAALPDDLAGADRGIERAAQELEALRKLAATAACPAAGEEHDRRKLVSVAVAALVEAESKVTKKLAALRTRRTVISGLAGREEKADRLLKEGKYAEYADALREIAKDVGTGALSRDYDDVAKDHARWQAVDDWSRFVADIRPKGKLMPQAAKELLEKLRKLPAEVLQLPDARTAKAWMEPWLDRLTSCTTEKLDTLRMQFGRIFESQFGEEIDAVITDQGGTGYPRYYCLLADRPKPTEPKRVKYVTGLPDANRTWPTAPLAFDPAVHVVADSPQKLLADSAKKILEEQSAQDATMIDQFAIDVVRHWANPPKLGPKERAIDPCLQAIILQFLLEKACAASPVLASGLVKSQAAMNAGNDRSGQKILIKGVDNSAYTKAFDPTLQDSPEVEKYRSTCVNFVRQAGAEADIVADGMKEDAKQLVANRESLRAMQCVGRLRKNAAGGWSISGSDALLRAGKQIHTAGGVRDGFKMVPCATCDEKGTIPPGTDVKARAGDPVFIIKAAKDRGG